MDSCFQKYPNMLVDDGTIKDKARFVQNFDEKVREFNGGNCAKNLDLKNYELLMHFLL